MLNQIRQIGRTVGKIPTESPPGMRHSEVYLSSEATVRGGSEAVTSYIPRPAASQR